jgi:hypothetical protein
MNIEKLRRWLSKNNIDVAEERLQADGSLIVYFTTQLPTFPFGGRHVWYPLILRQGQTEVSQSEIDALLRHCWHGELEIPKPTDD